MGRLKGAHTQEKRRSELDTSGRSKGKRNRKKKSASKNIATRVDPRRRHHSSTAKKKKKGLRYRKIEKSQGKEKLKSGHHREGFCREEDEEGGRGARERRKEKKRMNQVRELTGEP